MYRPLKENEIRLMILHPGSDITCDPVHVSLTALPSYETISYVWGKDTERGTILLDNEHADVPASTRRALKRMQVDEDRILWIDAVCINQNDDEERSRQVALMATIYSSGTKNLVWLGEDDGHSAEAAVASMQGG
ncbi:hypothetical protein AMS68_005225 [Peltaster fructicola]|uniref:Heterokaryon incompatibility domain-containing protein n=1 Tax=Peltaster fructicola TaxID=286661 RepID=A0A6H0XYN3_9PEZI|nr:hypothetical protein AMS68_005225 [Peltaster fructicola]